MILANADQNLVKAAIRANEIGSADIYRLSWAGKGNSGASIGLFQTDLAANSSARAAIWKVLISDGFSGNDATAITSRLSSAQIESPFAADVAVQIDAALHTSYGMAVVDGMDASAFSRVLQFLVPLPSMTVGAACAAGCWINMTGPPFRLRSWLQGTPDIGLDIPFSGLSPVTLSDMYVYLGQCDFYVKNPRNFDHLKVSIASVIPSEA